MASSGTRSIPTFFEDVIPENAESIILVNASDQDENIFVRKDRISATEGLVRDETSQFRMKRWRSNSANREAERERERIRRSNESTDERSRRLQRQRAASRRYRLRKKKIHAQGSGELSTRTPNGQCYIYRIFKKTRKLITDTYTHSIHNVGTGQIQGRAFRVEWCEEKMSIVPDEADPGSPPE